MLYSIGFINTQDVWHDIKLIFVHQLVKDLGWSHGDVGLDRVHLVITSDIAGRSLALNQFLREERMRQMQILL